MRSKPIKLLLAAVILLTCEDPSGAAESGLYTRSTPYDHETALIQVLEGRYPAPEHSPPGVMDQLFGTARRFHYSADKKGDEWQLPQATENSRSGDCEDKALWLYASLRQAGYQNLGLVVGKYRSRDSGYHVWLMRTDRDGNIYILDPTIQNKIWPLTAFEPGFYKPYFLFDGSLRYRFF